MTQGNLLSVQWSMVSEGVPVVQAQDYTAEAARAVLAAGMGGLDSVPYLIMVAKRKRIDASRARKARHYPVSLDAPGPDGEQIQVPSREPGPEAAMIVAERSAMVRAVMDRFPELTAWAEGSTYEDIAGAFGIPLGTVRSRISRQKEAARRALVGRV
jgi:DNA-directed RNA polymerase specialized sigma24 family protein